MFSRASNPRERESHDAFHDLLIKTIEHYHFHLILFVGLDLPNPAHMQREGN